MNETYETKKYAADKMALFGLFVVALLIARLIIASRSTIVLSEPIKLSCADLSVSMPTGNGWQSEKQWRYRENTFTLSSIFAPSSGSVLALAHCRYLLAATKAAPDARFKQKASAIGASIAETGQIQTDRLTINWAHIKRQKALSGIFFATTQLPNSRQLDIEVHQATDDTDFGERVFKLITENLKFEDNKLLEAGSEIIANIKSKGLNSLLGPHSTKGPQNSEPLHNQGKKSFFLIKNMEKHTVGFTMDLLIDSDRNAPLNIQIAGFSYIRGRYTREQVMFFQSDNSFDEFVWKNEVSSLAGRTGSETVLRKNRIMAVRRFNPWAKEKICQIGPAAVPGILLEQLFRQMLNSNHKQIIVDIIEADGTIIPAFISRIEAQDLPVAEEAAGYALRVELLNGRGFSQQVHFDNQKQISKISLQQESLYILERTDEENILREFPEQADYILQKNKMLEQNQPQHRQFN